MSKSFKVGNTYIAKGFSNYGSIVKVKILGRTDATVKVGCDILFKESARKKISWDEEGNEVLNLGRGFTVNAVDVDAKLSAVHEAQMLQDEILRDDVRARGYVQNLVEDVLGGMDNISLRGDATASVCTDMTEEDWDDEEDPQEMTRYFISDMVWNRTPLVRVPARLQIELPADLEIGVYSDEVETVTDAVKYELNRLGITHGYELSGYEVLDYTLTPAMTYEFDEADLDMGLSDIGAGDLSTVKGLAPKYANSILGSIR